MNVKIIKNTKIGEHIPSGFSMSTIFSIKHDVYKGKDCMKKFYEDN